MKNATLELIKALPKIVGVEMHERFSKRNELLYTIEVRNINIVYDHVDYDKNHYRNRIEVAEIPKHLVKDHVAYEFGMDLLSYNALCHRKFKTLLEEIEQQQIAVLKKSLYERSGSTITIIELEAIMSIDEAERGVWWG